jgi:hypothetical protein
MGKVEQLDRLLDVLEEKIDLSHAAAIEKLHIDALHYHELPYLPLTIIFPVMDGLTLFPYVEAFDDPAKMLYNELLTGVYGTSVYNSVMLKDHLPLHVRSNHGIGILASLFGATCKIVNNNMPWVDHMGKEEVKKAISRGIPEFDTALGRKVMQTHDYYSEKLKSYPKCSRAIRITQPDLQGPFDIAHLLLGNDIFYDVYDSPQMLHELLDIITETYIGFRRHIEPRLTDHAGSGAVYLHGSIYGGKVLLKDDTALINISGPMYDEFSGSYNERILAAFGGGSNHYCGPLREWHFESIYNPWLRGINYGNPEMHNFKETYEYWARYKVPIVQWSYNQPFDKLKEVYELNIKTGVTLMTQAEDYCQAKRILEHHSSDHAQE